MIEIRPLEGIGEVLPGTDLVQLLGDALEKSGCAAARPGDVLVVTQKIVSKAEDRFVDLAEIAPGAEANRIAAITLKDPRLVELVCRESSEVVRAAPNVLITRHRCGFVMANAGIDRSNLGERSADWVLLLPVDADASAERLRQGLAARFGKAPAIVVSDSFGRPWRYGVVCVAIGASGLPSLIDRRGEHDRDGRELEVTQVALGDMVATAAGLATGEGAEGIPAALVRGLVWQGSSPASALIRPPMEDLFR
jgi:coenzyme F420-0:L-glutamate ligase/coenzyme F420-1:gamma-L-glutamate ligase